MKITYTFCDGHLLTGEEANPQTEVNKYITRLGAEMLKAFPGSDIEIDCKRRTSGLTPKVSSSLEDEDPRGHNSVQTQVQEMAHRIWVSMWTNADDPDAVEYEN